MKLTRFAAAGLMSAALALMGGVALAQDAPSVLVTTINMTADDIPTIDPTLSETVTSVDVLNHLFPGVTMSDVATGDLELGMATAITPTPNDDGTVLYTIDLLENVAWVRYNAESGAVEQVTDADGNPLFVTAADAVYGMTRALDPATAAPYSYVLLPYIVGAAEFNAGEADASALALEVVDDNTYTVLAPDAAAFAPSIYGLWMARPVPQIAIDAFGDSWTDPANIATYGPYALKEWVRGSGGSLSVVVNPFWAGAENIPAATIEEVQWRFLDQPQAFAEYEAGNVQAIDVPVDQVPRVQADPVLSAEYYRGVEPCTYYLGFDNTEAPTDNVHLRRALSYSIDRVAIADNVLQIGWLPAGWFSRPGLNAAPTPELNPDLGVTFDLEYAQAELAIALEELGIANAADLSLTYSYNDTARNALIAQAIQQQWTENLGVTVAVNPMEGSTYFSTISEEHPGIARVGWCKDYNDANNFLYDVMYSESSQNDVNFFNDEFDALVEEARLLTDVDERRALYVRAEEILNEEEAAIAPLFWYAVNSLIKPNVEYVPSVVTNQAYNEWTFSS
jgi:oligopeptide transport system substrate-binding protein